MLSLKSIPFCTATEHERHTVALDAARSELRIEAARLDRERAEVRRRS